MATAATEEGADLAWEEIQHSQSAPAKPQPSAATAIPGSIGAADGGSVGAAATAGAVGPFGFLTLAFYRQLFDVTTKGVLRRLLAAYWGFLRPSLLQFADYMPMSGTEEGEIAPGADGATAPVSPGVDEVIAAPGGPVSLFTTKPDLYGPMWICATLVFLIGAMANLGSWATFSPSASATDSSSPWKYDFSLVTQAFFLVFGSVVVVPSAAWAVLRYHGAPAVTLVTLVCLWGYSLVHYIPATLLCAVPSVSLRWVAALFASVGAALFLVRAIVPLVRETNAFIAPVTGTVVALQILLGLLLRLYFFSFSPAPEGSRML